MELIGDGVECFVPAAYGGIKVLQHPLELGMAFQLVFVV
jgi:hypothetical protein